jgi:hypothetical protein
MLAVTDIFRLFAALMLVSVPLMVFFKRYNPHTARAAVH